MNADDEEPLGRTLVRARAEDPRPRQDSQAIDDSPSAVADRLVGTTLGEYQVLSRLGRGGMGVVYRGVQPVIGKPVAIKVLVDALEGDATSVKRLLEEARAVNAIRHPNIVDIFSFGTTPHGHSYFVMELLDGDALDEYLRYQGGRLPVPEALELLSQVATALGAAHAAGVIHRDLKPGNVFVVKLVDDTRFIKLLDFGLAKRDGAHKTGPTTNSMVGTPLYMAPEQASGAPVGPQADLYALGCIAYELVCGRPPFEATTLYDIAQKHLKEAPVSPDERVSGLPPELTALILSLLAKRPEDRPASAQVVKKALERIEADLASGKTAPTGFPAVEKAPRRRIQPAPQRRLQVEDEEPSAVRRARAGAASEPLKTSGGGGKRAGKSASGLAPVPDALPKRGSTGKNPAHLSASTLAALSGAGAHDTVRARPDHPAAAASDDAATRLDRAALEAPADPPAPRPSQPDPSGVAADTGKKLPAPLVLGGLGAVAVALALVAAAWVLHGEAEPMKVVPVAPIEGTAEAGPSRSAPVTAASIEARLADLAARGSTLQEAEQRVLKERLSAARGALAAKGPEATAEDLDAVEALFWPKR